LVLTLIVVEVNNNGQGGGRSDAVSTATIFKLVAEPTVPHHGATPDNVSPTVTRSGRSQDRVAI
jgi:hypothetical protein